VFDRIHCSGEFTVHSAGLSAKSAGWGFHCSNFESNGFRPVFTEFYRIRPIFSKTGGIGGSRFFSLRRFFKHCSRFHMPRPSTPSCHPPPLGRVTRSIPRRAALSRGGAPLPVSPLPLTASTAPPLPPRCRCAPWHLPSSSPLNAYTGLKHIL
jgi:hypothetical protein